MMTTDNKPRPSGATAVTRAAPAAIGRHSHAASRLFLSATSIQLTGRFLRRQLWAWPIIAALVIAGAGWYVHQAVEGAMRAQRSNELNAMVDASATAVRVWMGEQRINATLIADDDSLRPLVSELLALADGTPASERRLIQAPAQDKLRGRLKSKLTMLKGYVGYFVVSPGSIVLASDQDAPIGKKLAGYRKDEFDLALSGKATVTKPFRSPLLLADEHGELRANLPSMFAIAPLRDAHAKPIAALGLRIRPEEQFTRILQVLRFGETGETYAFDKKGLLLSESRFDDMLKELGLLADQPDAHSILTVEVRDPQVNMALGERPKLRRAAQPLTRLAADAAQGKDGHDPDGYRDYRGSPSVGAWRWLPEYDFAVATEVDTDEAFAPVFILQRVFWILMAILGLSAVGIFCAMLYMSHQHKALQKATLEARQLGQYALEQKLGAGGMGTVYRAKHAMLRRPTAVKLLDVDKMSDAAVARFEREVQLTSGLTHPNTVAVFDYGRTPEGIFYYAMEFLDGMNLDDLVARAGPLPEARAVYILRQICGSLGEAHAAGLVHRDVKPANIFITHRGGLYDFVKVLDFGLVKSAHEQGQANLTNPHSVLGTPLYLSPEAVGQSDSLDARADVYSVAAVAYYMLTGTPIFTSGTILEICLKHAKEKPELPSARLGKPITPALEALIMRCLAKAPAERPKDAGALLSELDALDVVGAWTSADAASWWASQDSLRATKRDGDALPQTPRDNATPASDSTMAYVSPKNSPLR